MTERLRELHAFDRRQPAGGDGVDQCSMVSFVAIGVCRGELPDGAVEPLAVAEVRGDRDQSPERACARASVHPHAEA